VGPVNGHHIRPVALLSMHSRFEPSAGGFERASDALADAVARRRDLAWATQMRTYRLMAANRKQMAVARAVQAVRGAARR
jgi:hypothetical protein